MRIGIAFDLAPAARPDAGPDDLFEEFDKPETIDALAQVLRHLGHDVRKLGNGRPLLEALLADPPDLVWNMAEGQGSLRSREARVPAVCELLGIPCTGSDPLTLAATLDKPVAKTLVAGVVAVPHGQTVMPDAAASLPEGSGPWVVKPAFEGSSKGIRARSLVDDPNDALQLAQELGRDYRQPILIEEYVEGDEVTVGVLGDGSTARVIGLMRIRPKQAETRFIYALESKRDWDVKIVYEAPAQLDPDVARRVEQAAINAYRTLGCRDVARIDFRVRDGVPVFLEANPLPGLAPDWSDLVILAKGVGLSHAELIRLILDAAIERLGLPR